MARFSEPFIRSEAVIKNPAPVQNTPADRWILARCRALVERVTAALEEYEYAAAKSEIEGFFWRDLADNYLEMAKLRLYDPADPAHTGACLALRTVLLTLVKLMAPFFPYITDVMWSELFGGDEGFESVHCSTWPEPEGLFPEDHQANQAEGLGELLVSIATAARRFKSEHALSLGSQLAQLQIATRDAALGTALTEAAPDLQSVTRAQSIHVCEELDPGLVRLEVGLLEIGIQVP